MRQRFTSLVLAILLLTAVPARGEIIDRIVAIIDANFIITLSDIRKERSIQVALGRDPGNDDKVIESLVERRIFEQQIALFREIEVDEDEVSERLRTVRIPADISVEDVRTTVRDEIRRYEFTVQRFRPFVKVTDEEVRDFYEKVALPTLRAAGGTIPPLEEGLLAARSFVIADKMEQEVGEWLKDLKGRISIEKISK